MKGITMNTNTIENVNFDAIAYADVTYAKVVKQGKQFRVETKSSDDMDEWPTLVGVYADKAEALTVIANAGWTFVPSWVVAGNLEDYHPKTGL